MKKSVLVNIFCAVAMLMIMTIFSYAADTPAPTADNLVQEIQEIAGNNRTILTATIARATRGEPFHLVYLSDVSVLRGTAPAAGTQFNVASGNFGFAQPYPVPKVGQKVVAIVDNPAPNRGNGQVMTMMAQLMVVHFLLDANDANLAAAKAAAAETPLNAQGREAGNQPKQKTGKVTVDPARGVTSIEIEQ
jgi:hypothetical protein